MRGVPTNSFRGVTGLRSAKTTGYSIKMNEFDIADTSRRWGIDLLGGLYVVATCFVLATFRDPNMIVMAMVIPSAIVLLLLGVGLVFRFGPARPITVAVLWVTIALSGLLCILYVSQIFGLVAEVPAIEPKKSLARTGSRVFFSWYALSYLIRPDVKAEFA